MAFEYTTKIYLDAANGNDTTGDGSEGNPWQFFNTSPAKNLVETNPPYTYNVIFVSSSSENIIINLTASGQNQPFVKLTALNSAKFIGTGTFITINTLDPNYWGVWLFGFEITGYNNVITTVTTFNPSVFQNCNIYNCNINLGYAAAQAAFRDTILRNVNFSSKQAGHTALGLHNVEGCTFVNVKTLDITYPYIVLDPRVSYSGETGGFPLSMKRNVFIDTMLVISQNVDNINYSDLIYNNYYGVRGSFMNTLTPGASPLVSDLVPFNSLAAMQAEYLSIFGETTDKYEKETFNNIMLDAYGFQTTDQFYINGQYIGANRYGSSAIVDNGVANYENLVNMEVFNYNGVDILRGTASVANRQATLIIPTIDRARKIRRVVLHFKQFAGDGVFVPSNEVLLSLSPSLDGVNYTSSRNFSSGLVGIWGGGYDFDTVNLVAKGAKVTFTLLGNVDINIYVYGATIEFYDIAEQLPAYTTRTEIIQKATDARGYFINTETHDVLTSSGAMSWQSVKNNLAITKMYADAEQTNIKSFDLNGTIYETFATEPVQVTNVKAVVAGSEGMTRDIKQVPCSRFETILVRYKNRYGTDSYLFFYQESKTTHDTSEQTYVQFQDYYKNVNGDTQNEISLINDFFDVREKFMIDDLRANQNIWISRWQISADGFVLEDVSDTLPVTERLVKATLTVDQYAQFRFRFVEGDKISLISATEKLEMFGYVTQISDGDGYFMLLNFKSWTGNNDLTSLDNFVAGGTELFLTAWDAWEMCTFADATEIPNLREKDKMIVNLTVKTNPQNNYRI